MNPTMTSLRNVPLVAVDWGTTHRRAYAVGHDSQCLAQYEDDTGALAAQGRFGPALRAALDALGVAPQRIVLSGMVGSALGWHAVPYVGPEVGLRQLRHHLWPVPDSDGLPATFIVPGYCVRNAQGCPDVMRGEETQLLGAVIQGLHDGVFVLPGTHSKWVALRTGQVRSLRTYMTGELYALLGQHGTLAAAALGACRTWDVESENRPQRDQFLPDLQAHSPAMGQKDGEKWAAEVDLQPTIPESDRLLGQEDSHSAFVQGVQDSAEGALSHQLFGARARVVCGDLPATQARAYLSGLLVGAELRDGLGLQANHHAPLYLIGSPALAQRYQDGAALLGAPTQVLDARSLYLQAVCALLP